MTAQEFIQKRLQEQPESRMVRIAERLRELVSECARHAGKTKDCALISLCGNALCDVDLIASEPPYAAKQQGLADDV